MGLIRSPRGTITPQADPLSGLPAFCLAGSRWRYVLRPAETPNAPLLIAAHGSDRDVRGLVESLDLQGTVTLLAPLFPAQIDGQDAGDDYKFLTGGGEDYRAVMDAILAEALQRLGDVPTQIWLFGFSGGAQFAQRYALIRADRLDGLILAAPGGVTLLRPDIAWWPGLKGAGAALGEEPDISALARLRTALIVGSDDRASGMVNRGPGTKFGAKDADLAGVTRIEKARSLFADLSALGAEVSYSELPGVGHKLAPCAEAASQIMRGWLKQGKQTPPGQSTSQINNRPDKQQE